MELPLHSVVLLRAFTFWVNCPFRLLKEYVDHQCEQKVFSFTLPQTISHFQFYFMEVEKPPWKKEVLLRP